MCASGTGRFIAGTWFSDEPLPLAYASPSAAKVQEFGVSGRNVDRATCAARNLRLVDIETAEQVLAAN